MLNFPRTRLETYQTNMLPKSYPAEHHPRTRDVGYRPRRPLFRIGTTDAPAPVQANRDHGIDIPVPAQAFDTDLFFAKSLDGGDNWSNPQNLSNAGNYISRLHLVADNGTIMIAVQERADGIQSDILLYRSNDDGNNWLPIQNVSNNSGNSSRPDISILGEEENRRIYLVWADETYAADSQICFRYSMDDGANWSDLELLSQATGEALWPIITGKQSEQTDSIYSVWYHAQAGTFDYEIYGRSGINNIEAVGEIQGIVTNEENGEAIENAIISIGNFSISTDEYGFYQLLIPAGFYELSCSASNFETFFDADLEILADETLIYDIELIEAQPVLFPPLSFTGVLEDDAVHFQWEMPQSNGTYIHWDNGENDSSVGGTNIPVFDVAIRFTANDLTDFYEHYLTKVRAYFDDTDCTIRLRIWSGGNQNYAGNLIYEELWEDFSVGWNEKTLSQPLLIDVTQELWIGYRVENPNGVYPAGTDSGAAVPFKGDMLLYGSNWVSMSAYFGWDINWNIQGFVDALFDPWFEVIDLFVPILTDVNRCVDLNKPIFTAFGCIRWCSLG